MARYSAPVYDRLVLAAQARITPGHEHVLRLAGRTVPASIPIQLLLDTGSARSTLVASVLERLQAFPFQDVRHETALAATQTSLFWIRLEFPHSKLAAIPELLVARSPLPPSLASFHGVIGRDVLRRWESFHYQGRRGRLIIRDVPSWLFRWIGC